MYVSEIQNELKQMAETCDTTVLFSLLTDAQDLLTNKGLWDCTLGEVEVITDDDEVSLPRDVDTILQVNRACSPTIIRDAWFKYHLNGPGDSVGAPCGYTWLSNDSCTAVVPEETMELYLELDDARDVDKSFKVFGWDANGERIFTDDTDDNPVDGWLVPTDDFANPAPNPNVNAVLRIDRVEKAVFVGYCTLYGRKADGSSVLLGRYEPTETKPTYRRIKVTYEDGADDESNTVVIRYKKRNNTISSLYDWINIDNRLALMMAVKAVRYYQQSKFDLAASAEMAAERLMQTQQRSRNPDPANAGPQINVSVYNDECTMWG